MQFPEIYCTGTPYEIGHTHGTQARAAVARSIDFYAGLFKQNSKQDWDQVRETARQFEVGIKEKWPAYWEEMSGLADGAQIDILSIIALNVRTEIAFGLFTDGCTAASWFFDSPTPSTNGHTSGHTTNGHTNGANGNSNSASHPTSYLGQNWDWMPDQKPQLIILTIHQPPHPTIKMVTEAGIIGKIGLNTSGVGVCLNAIRAKGMAPSRLPVHLGLRMVLESHSAREAVAKLEEYGMASSAHMLIADAKTGGVGLEFTASTFARCEMDEKGRVFHSNHLLCAHSGAVEPEWWKDSPSRVKRIEELADNMRLKGSDGPSFEQFSTLFEDHENGPASICRHVDEAKGVGSETLFGIWMDLGERRAVVRVGRGCGGERSTVLEF